MRNYDMQSNRRNVCFSLGVYWVILVLWQNIFFSLTKTSFDSVLKVFLLVYLTYSFLKYEHLVNSRNFMILGLFSITQLITFLSFDSQNISLGIIVSYIYPVLVLFLVHCVGNNFTISKVQVDRMNDIILVVLISSIAYTALIEPGQYIVAFSARNSGYGSELSSFFLSMHEYALYIFYGITICINRIADKSRTKLWYYVLLIAFSINLVLTFSRTAITGCIVYLVVYAVLNRKERISKVIVISVFLLIIYTCVNSSLHDYLFQVVWKSGESTSRDSLMTNAIEYFRNGQFQNKLFGFGISNARNHFSTEIGYGSIHNGYLQVLIYYGIFGLTFMVVYLLSILKDCIRFFRIDDSIALQSIGLLFFCIIAMMPQTFIIFSSSTDCFFLTMMFLVVPKYQRNAVLEGGYY